MPNVPRIQEYAEVLGITAGQLFPEDWKAPRRKTYTYQYHREPPAYEAGHGYEDALC